MAAQTIRTDQRSEDELASEMQEALAALADIELRFDEERAGIRRWVGPESAKERLLKRLSERRFREREPLVRWLEEAHARSMLGRLRRVGG